MTDQEFDAAARRTAARLEDTPLDDRIAAACRGSGNPAALAWIAEECGLGATSRVGDLGSGLGGPAAWLARRYGCRPVALEPAAGAATQPARLFGLAAVRADAAAAPFRNDAFELALLFGVLSVARAPNAVVAEAARLAPVLAVLEYCSTGRAPCRAGGSEFPTHDELAALLTTGGFGRFCTIEVTMAAPARWIGVQTAAFDATGEIAAAHRAECSVRSEIDAGRLTPVALVARRG